MSVLTKKTRNRMATQSRVETESEAAPPRPPAFFPNLDRARISRVLDWIRPVFWLWLASAGVLAIAGYFVSESRWRQIGVALLGFWFAASVVLYIIAIILDMPACCAKGHTDIGLYYGRWSCRTCYRLSRTRVRRRSKSGKS